MLIMKWLLTSMFVRKSCFLHYFLCSVQALLFHSIKRLFFVQCIVLLWVFVVLFVLLRVYLYGVPCGIEGETEGLVEGRLTVVTANSGFLLDDPLLSGHVDHVQLHVQV